MGELSIRVKNILEALITSATSTGHPRHRAYIASQIGTTAEEVEQAAKNILQQGKPITKVEKELVKCILENRYNYYLRHNK